MSRREESIDLRYATIHHDAAAAVRGSRVLRLEVHADHGPAVAERLRVLADRLDGIPPRESSTLLDMLGDLRSHILEAPTPRDTAEVVFAFIVGTCSAAGYSVADMRRAFGPAPEALRALEQLERFSFSDSLNDQAARVNTARHLLEQVKP